MAVERFTEGEFSLEKPSVMPSATAVADLSCIRDLVSSISCWFTLLL